MIDEKQHHAVTEICEISTLNKDVSRKEFNSADNCKDQ